MIKKIYIILLFVVVLISLGIYSIKNSPSTNYGLSLNQAYELGYSKAINWNKDAQLLYITSSDSPNIKNETAENGNRRFWTLQFGMPNSSKGILITIKDGQAEVVKEYTDTFSEKDKFIDKDEIKTSVTKELLDAKEKYNLQKGIGWAIGYHFTLEKFDKIPTLSIYGLDKHGYQTVIQYNITTGDQISAKHKVTEGGSLLRNDKKLNLLNDTYISPIEIDISPNYKADKTMFAIYYSDPYTSKIKPCISKTTDGGSSWTDIGINEDALHIMFSKNYINDKTLFIITPNSVFKSSDNGKTFRLIYNDKNIEILSFDFYNQQLYIVTKNGIKLSEDYGNTWNGIYSPSGIKQIIVRTNKDIFLISATELFYNNNNNWSKVQLPLSGGIENAIITDNSLVISQANKLLILDLQSRLWQVIEVKNGVRYLYSSNYIKDLFYCYTQDNKLIEFKKKEGINKWESKDIFVPNNGNILKVADDPIGNLYYCIGAPYEWAPLGGSK